MPKREGEEAAREHGPSTGQRARNHSRVAIEMCIREDAVVWVLIAVCFALVNVFVHGDGSHARHRDGAGVRTQEAP